MRREAVATAGGWVRPGADERQGPGSGPPPCGKSWEQPPRPAPRRTRPGAQAAATRQALGVAARRRGADWRAGGGGGSSLVSGALLTAPPSTFDFGEIGGRSPPPPTASAHHPPPPPLGATFLGAGELPISSVPTGPARCAPGRAWGRPLVPLGSGAAAGPKQ